MPRWIEVSEDKQYQTRNGLPVRIYSVCKGYCGPYNSVHGAIRIGGCWLSYSWPSTGRAGNDQRTAHRYDLVELPPKRRRKIWLNVYDSGAVGHWTRTRADEKAAISESAGKKRIACIETEVEYHEGEGL